MRITILLLNQGRGSGEVAREHVRHLLKRNHKVYFIHPEIGEGVSGAVNLNVELGTEIIPVHEYLPSANSKQKQVARMTFDEANAYLPAYERALEEFVEEVDIIIGHHANISAIAVHNVAQRHSKPYVLFIHGTGIEPRHQGLYDDRIWQLIEQSIQRANGILVTTEYVRDFLVQPLVKISNGRFLILPSGVDLNEFHSQNTDGIISKYDLPDTYVICPGALIFSKGPQNVVSASEVYADLAFTIFIGAGELRAELERKLGSRGRFLGFVPAADKAKLINAAKLLVAAPEKKEHFGIVYAEALAGGTPPVAYEGGGVSSIITPEVGILTERSPEKLGQAVRHLLQNSELHGKMSKLARVRAEALFSYPVLVERLEKWLLGICARRH